MAKEELYNVGYLEDQDFDGGQLKVKNNLIVCLIWASWCGHCKTFLPEYQKLANEFKSSPSVMFCCIQQDGAKKSEKILGQRLKDIYPQFRGFPTVVYFKGGKLAGVLQDRTSTELKKDIARLTN
jgi:thiol-disulfide isomerase/thioredoxin